MNGAAGHFERLSRELSTRAARALLGQLGLTSDALREHLRWVFERPAGKPGSFLAEPVFEATFPWETVKQQMGDLSGTLLHADLVAAMDRPPGGLAEHRFGADRHPYVHQLGAWRALQERPRRSVVVTSGTGSGKTECFLVPILDDLAHERTPGVPLVGARALFLYPLNALINSQRERLRAWTAGFRGDVRFCLYNGDTPESGVPAREQRRLPQEVLSRAVLRQLPPPLLITNATMLEYMLVRAQDAPIIHASRGHLRWIVLDEAHTYVGSQAAELALLIRRVLLAFRVEPEDVHFVATSATMSSDDAARTQRELQRFLADVAGLDPATVSVIGGSRSVPTLDDPAKRTCIPTPEELDRLEAEERYARLAAVPRLRELRAELARGAMPLGEIGRRLNLESADGHAAGVLPLLDRCTEARHGGEAFLPLRGHFFHRTQPGIWACANRDCPGTSATPLAGESWPFGAVFLERRERCEHCEAPVLDIVVCNGCGSSYLACDETIGSTGRRVVARRFELDYDEFADELELLDTDLEADDRDVEATIGNHRLIAPIGPNAADTVIHQQSGYIDPPDDGLHVGIVLAQPDGSLPCPSCGARDREGHELFRPVQLGAPFFLSVAIPTVLEHTPEFVDGKERRPFGGRRLITFSDSRQGTARFAVKAQLDSERSYVRSVLYHQLAASRSATKVLSEEEQAELSAYESMSSLLPALESRKDDLRRRVGGVGDGNGNSNVIGSIGWADSRVALQNTDAVRLWLGDQWSELALGAVPNNEVARFCLYREFFRRPRRMNSLETLGLAALRYPVIERLSEQRRPTEWRVRGLPIQTWRDFLTLALDFFVRSYSAVDIPIEYVKWLGIPVRPMFLLGPDADRPEERQVRWPLIRAPGRRARLIRMLAEYLQIDPEDSEDAARINELLRAAWEVVRPMLTQYPEGAQLALEEHVELREVREAWLCPVTRRVLPVTLDGITPYLPEDRDPGFTRCDPVQLPLLPLAFWREPGGRRLSRDEIAEWLESDEIVADARRNGIWTEFSDRIAAGAPYFRVVEHSAQQSGRKLHNYEERFKSGKLNVLSCSTTMEMGVDIGGLSAVGMNNAPPSPANFLQRAGRAGRRGESVATSLTLCKATPHGEAVFRNPMWPFETPMFVPRVALDSERLVTRHVNSVALASFLEETGVSNDAHRLVAGWFFEAASNDQQAPADRFVDWCRDGGSVQVRQDIARLARRTVIDGVTPELLLLDSTEQLSVLASRWREEVEALNEQNDANAGADGRETPAQVAIRYQLKRIRGEYLLSELAAHGFLPGYGFPTDVVPFVPTTAEELRRQRKAGNVGTPGREDGFGMRRGFPSRELPVAIREYAPGANVVLDGRVYESGGLSLNWHIPAGDASAREVQALRQFWRCTGCGSTGTRAYRLPSCPACGRKTLRHYTFIRPAGFAVDIRYRVHNDINHPVYVPVNDPSVTAGSVPWLSLPRQGLGRYRYNSDGHIFHWSAGSRGNGYAICLECGRAASERDRYLLDLPPELHEHTKLRGGKDPDGNTRCSGNDHDWAISRGIWLGTETFTDVFELQLRDPVIGNPLDDKAAAFSLGVALRQALAERLGVNDREIGCAVARTITDDDHPTWSILLFDTATGGAGYVANVVDELGALLRAARTKLVCSRGCDAACHSCLLTFDTEHQSDDLDRHRALELLNADFLRSFDLPEDNRFFGSQTRLELLDLATAIRRALQRPGFHRLRLVMAGDPKNWEMEDWPLRRNLLRWATEGVEIELLTTRRHLQNTPVAVANALASLIEAVGIRLFVVENAGLGFDCGAVVAEAGGENRGVRWAVLHDASRAPGIAFANHAADELCVKVDLAVGMVAVEDAIELTAIDVRRTYEGTIHEIALHHQLDGPVTQFGENFWNEISATPEINEQVASGARLARVRYRDRYIRSPFVARLLIEVIRASQEAMAASDNLLVEVETADFAPETRPSSRISHNWRSGEERNEVASAAIEVVVSGSVFSTARRWNLPHARELDLKWNDGRECVIRLDQGFGYWKPIVDLPFGFERAPDEQVERLLTSGPEVHAGSREHPTFAYVGKVDTP